MCYLQEKETNNRLFIRIKGIMMNTQINVNSAQENIRLKEEIN